MVTKRDFIIVSLLMLLAAVPLVAGGVRIFSMITGAEILDGGARFAASPAPVVTHIVGATLFALLGALQFSTGLRTKHPQWHRMAGRVAALAGVAVALSGLWMTLFYPLGTHELLHWVRLAVSMAMALFIWLSIYAILNKHVVAHRNWMIRAYALGMGAGTQVLVFIPLYMIAGETSTFVDALAMSSAWLINIVVAEWVIAKQSTIRRRVQMA